LVALLIIATVVSCSQPLPPPPAPEPTPSPEPTEKPESAERPEPAETPEPTSPPLPKIEADWETGAPYGAGSSFYGGIASLTIGDKVGNIIYA